METFTGFALQVFVNMADPDLTQLSGVDGGYVLYIIEWSVFIFSTGTEVEQWKFPLLIISGLDQTTGNGI